MTVWQPPRETVRLRNATVTAVTGDRATITLDGNTLTGIPVYGLVSPGNKVLVAEQGVSLLVIGNPAAALTALTDRIAALETEARNARNDP